MKKNTVLLKDAKTWAKRWRKEEGDYNKHHKLKAFLIPKVDLQEVLTEGIDAARAYIGIDNNGVERLMIVGTKYDEKTGNYIDMITADPTNEVLTDGDIYDFTRPCPSACDPDSPLNK
ncbi:hypothetical protein [Flavobacterium sp. H122]|uniref:hypothetical protein n=1 Tax=Flavobacterium sp. H122 TaxID=2529860 RepID=UPI0010AA0B8B|nr:hypothetical protein [Flavobacterium sp. H122]